MLELAASRRLDWSTAGREGRIAAAQMPVLINLFSFFKFVFSPNHFLTPHDT